MPAQKIDLTDEEWMSLIDGNRDGLPTCCANLSVLRDDLINAARNGGEVTFMNQIAQHAGWVFPEHGDPTPAMAKVLDQLGVTIEADHEPRRVEL